MAPSIALEFLPEKVDGRALTVLDPMCGSGTVLASALERGHNAVGLDLDPLAILISRVTTSPINLDAFASGANAVIKAAQRMRSIYPPWVDQETDDFADYWFSNYQRTRLGRLSRAISEHLCSSAVTDALYLAMSRIIITKAPKASLARDTSHSRPHRVTPTGDFDIYEGFLTSARDLARLLGARTASGRARVITGDSRIMSGIGANSIDLTITSPPYLNAIDYLRGHRLALIWLGHTVAELRNLRGTSIGSERGLTTAAENSNVEMIVSEVAKTASKPSTLPTATIRRYASDIAAFARQAFRVSKPGASLLLVVGNSTVRGNFVRNDLVSEQALTFAGFKLDKRVERTLPANRRYLPVTQRTATAGGLANRMMTETVLYLSKGSSA
jgi:hypothetical protein